MLEEERFTQQNMPEIKPSSLTEKLRKLTPTPPPKWPELVEPSALPNEPDELLAAIEHEETWILLAARHVLRIADFREVEEVGTTSQPASDATGQTYEEVWPVPGLVVNGKAIPKPDWSFEELLTAIGAGVISPPQTRAWQRGKNTPRRAE